MFVVDKKIRVPRNGKGKKKKLETATKRLFEKEKPLHIVSMINMEWNYIGKSLKF